ncbi:Histidine biosynthesis bifunctional protein HisIE [Buchnera aphidicola (Eriosoma lanigerum)]|uniref:bifunctional phosphoribosyl-AMP cyclohydrolase/phosphoribosyl-ATP diphosphatase HisIE n=1 Tax=Buchnera aphidicola TaxID=9 RepID=UPI003464DD8C
MLLNENLNKLNWKKNDGLLPAIIQHHISGEVLMHGYMNSVSLEKTLTEKLVTFYSRSKKRLWTKGETSNNSLFVMDITVDCDYDTILVFVEPKGNTCHLDRISCFPDVHKCFFSFLLDLEKLIEKRKRTKNINSYTSDLFVRGTQRIAQKVAEEAIEVALSAVSNQKNELISESSDLIYHFLVLLRNQNINFSTIVNHLKNINLSKNNSLLDK